jgi:glycerol transport system ATP-binding protein
LPPLRQKSSGGDTLALELADISLRVGAATYLYPMDLRLEPGTLTVLLGATRAGKTSLMRIMAGLDVPTQGRIRMDGKDVTGVPVRERNVAMVYQQFINYPSMTVFDNIASPLKLRGRRDVDARVADLARKLHIEPFLQRLPAELSGGQQQRVALARALAKEAPLILLDEPLVNLDYKLREELREELAQIFATGNSAVVYATTEPKEALLLGGHSAVLDAGELLQYGPTAEVFHRPQSIRVARAFSDPPMNLIKAQAANGGVRFRDGLELRLKIPAAAAAGVTVGVRANSLRDTARPGDIALSGSVQLAEISGSDTFLHAETSVAPVVAQLTGVHRFELGTPVTLYLQPSQVYLFGASGDLVLAPDRPLRPVH